MTRFLQENSQSINFGARVLNVGSGGGFSSMIDAQAFERGFTVVSVDIDTDRNPEVVGDISIAPFCDNCFDAIFIFEVLEHVKDPISAASELVRLLKPNGQLVLTVPFIFPLHDRPYDFFRYTKYGLSHLFEKLNNLEIQERNSWTEAILVLVARLTFERGRRFKLASLFLIPVVIVLVPVALLVSMLLPSDFITTGYVLSGRKPVNPE